MVKRWYEREIKNGAREKLAEKIVANAAKKVLVEIVEEIKKKFVVSIEGDEFTFLTPKDEWTVPIDEVVENAICKFYNSEMTDKDYDEMCETIVKHQYEQHKEELDEMDAKIDKIMQEHYNKVHSEKKSKRKEDNKNMDRLQFLVDVLNRNGYDLEWNGKKLVNKTGEKKETYPSVKKATEFLEKAVQDTLGLEITIDVTGAPRCSYRDSKYQFSRDSSVVKDWEEEQRNEWLKGEEETRKSDEELTELAQKLMDFDGEHYLYSGYKYNLQINPACFYLNKVVYNVQLRNEQRMVTLRSLVSMVKNEKINLNHAIQRHSEQWSKEQENALIDSLMKAIVLPPIILSNDGETVWCLDGKQRLSTLLKFYYEGLKVNLDGMKITYEDLEQEKKDFLDNTNINMITYYDLTDEQTALLFTRLNNGTALSGDQKLRGIESLEVLSTVKEILSHSFFEKVNFTKGQLRKSEDETVILQTMMLLAEDFEIKNFSFKEVQRFVEETDVETIKELAARITTNLDILDGIIEEKQKNLKKINLPMIIANARDDENWKNNILDFLENYESKEDYKVFCMGSTSQKQMVEGRNNFFKNL